MYYAYANNGYGARALKDGKPIVYPSSTGTVLLNSDSLTFSDGWCETDELWVVNHAGMESVAFKKACQLGTN